jgi:hypothetical protein
MRGFMYARKAKVIMPVDFPNLTIPSSANRGEKWAAITVGIAGDGTNDHYTTQND